MKPLVAALLLLAFLGIEACSSTRSSRTTLPPPPPPPPDATAPVTQAPAPSPPPAPTHAVRAPPPSPAPPPAAVQAPAPAPPAADPPRTLGFEEGMQKVSDAGVEDSLEKWADGKDVNLDHVIKRVGVFLDVAAKIKWDDNKKRDRDPADHDKIAHEATEAAKVLLAAAKAGKTDQIKTLSDQLLQHCVDCHTKYK